MNAAIQELKSFSRAEKLFILFAMIAGFCISGEYASTRPASSAIFLSVFSTEAIPIVWLISVPFNLAVVYFYNRFLPKIGPQKMMAYTSSFVMVFHLFCAISLHWCPKLIFLQFLLKDTYIVLMFKQLWSMIHSTISSTRAKYLYGCIYGMGTMGAILGSLIPSFTAVDVGSEQIFLCSIPFYALLLYSYSKAYKLSALKEGAFFKNLTLNPSPMEGFSLIRKSRYLIASLCLVVFMQVSIGLMDYQFNAHVAMNILDKDLRTEYVGSIVGLTNLLSLILQFVGGFLLVHILGVRGSHLFIPMMLLASSLTSFAIPTFTVITLGNIFIKSIDFSIFGVIREMLYTPLRLDEKYRAKAIIDIFAYRSSKALVSILILGLQFFFSSQILEITSAFSVTIIVAWIITMSYLFRKPMEALDYSS